MQKNHVENEAASLSDEHIFRPRLTVQELMFLVEVLTAHRKLAEKNHEEFEACQRRVDVLRDKFVMYPGRFFKEFKAEK